VFARADDGLGGISPDSNTNSFTVDTLEPETTLTSFPAAATNSSSAGFSFTGDGTGSGVTSFECSLDAGAFATCTDPQNLSGLAEGSHTFQVRAVDTAGNTDSTPASHTWMVDLTAPNTTLTNTPAALSGSSVTFEFSGDDPSGSGVASFECRLDSGAFSGCTTPHTLTGLSDGPHTFEARAIDAAGNLDASPAGYAWTVDSIAPPAPTVLTPADGASVNTTQPPVTGAGEPNSTITIFIDNAQAGSATADGAGSWSFTPPALEQGAHTVHARATDAVGNISPNSSTNSFTVDTVAPTASIAAVSPDPRTTPVTSITISFSESVTGFGLADLAFTRDGATVALTSASLSGGPTSYTLGGLSGLTGADGAYTLTLLAGGVQDGLGHPLAANVVEQWAKDASPPETTITASPPPATNSGNATFAFTGSDAGLGVASFECALDGGAFTACTSPASFSGLADGAHSFAVRAIDAIDNVDASPASFAWTIDSTPLSVTLEQAAEQNDPAGNAPVRFTVTFNKPVTTFDDADVALSGTAPGALSAAVSGSGTLYTVRVSGMIGNGTIVATVPAGVVTDAAGNGNAASTSVDNSVTFAPTSPIVTGIVRADPSPTGAASVRFNVTFGQSVVGVDVTDFSLAAAGVTGATISGVSGGGAIYVVTVAAGSGDGSLGLNLIDDDSISGFVSGVALGGTGVGNGDFTGQIYTIDRTAPAAALQPLQAVAQGTESYTFTVTYSDAMALARASIGDGDLQVSGPRGYSQPAALFSATPMGDSPQIVAVYTIQAPGGSWEGTDNGTYQIALPAGEVLDRAGNSVPEGALGSFSVALEARVYLPLIR
jgi:hypothetical protein